MKETKQQKAARRFAETWRGRGYEKGESQPFWLSLLRDVFGVEQPESFILFEDKVKLTHTNFIDARIPSTRVLIEQKSINVDLRKPIICSDRKKVTPYEQAKRYIVDLPVSKHPRWVVTCNFKSFFVYDMERPNGDPEEILLENLPKEYYRLQFLVDGTNSHVKYEKEVSLQAGEIVGLLYNALHRQFHNPEQPESLRSLNVLCVRLVFCLYAEDAGLFGRHAMFHDYLAQFAPERMRQPLIDLFRILNTPDTERDPYLDEALLAFPYVNGGLFAGDIEIPRFNAEIANLLLTHASNDFDWSHISPTIFGAVFESTLNPQTRRKNGMHYTSVENIHKVIGPLFLDELQAELEAIKRLKRGKKERITAFRKRLSSLRFLDPACGSGNFLTEIYLSLRRLENESLWQLYNQGITQFSNEFGLIQVSINQLFGIEINDFAVSVARTALWIAESQMRAETERIVGNDLTYFPLNSNPNIMQGNALLMDWQEACGGQMVDYIVGNPPFTGARIMEKEQKADILHVFGKQWPGVGDLDYVCGWYKKAADYIRHTQTACALVSSNSITQGEQVPLLWKNLMADGIQIDFAYRTFRWNSESTNTAKVHCVIVGFSCRTDCNQKKCIFNADDGKTIVTSHINAYLLPMNDVYVEKRTHPICDVPEIGIGNKPIDEGNYLFTKDEMEDFIKTEPAAAPYFRPWYGSKEFINNCPRYCLWLGNCSPAQLRRMPHCLKRVEAVRNFRLKSKSKGTVELADKPTRFHVENMPQGNYILIPQVSSERRAYIPMGFMTPDILCSNLVFLMPDATLYHFGVLNSSVHMAWMRMVAGRLKSDYRYSKGIVYNNFPWPRPTDAQRDDIAHTAQAILEARRRYPDSSLADLYDDTAMPVELRSAHRKNDLAVMRAYGFPADASETRIISELFTLVDVCTGKNQE